MQTKIHAESEKKKRLTQLDLVEDDLLDAITHGENRASGAGEFHPVGFSGTLLWGECCGAVRELLAARGWVLQNPKGLPVIVHPSGSHRVVVVTGDVCTGTGHGRPKRKRGPETAKAVIGNMVQLNLFQFSGVAFPITLRPGRSATVTWFLLVHRAEHEIRSELSLPAFVREDGMVTEFVERIPLRTLSVGPNVDPTPYGTDDEVDVPVRRKKAK